MRQSVANKLLEFNASERALDPFVGEVVGSRLMRHFGIGAPETIELVYIDDLKKYDLKDWVIKPLAGANARAKHSNKPEAFNILVRKIPQTISLYSLREIFGVIGSYPMWHIDGKAEDYLETLQRREVQIFRWSLHHGFQRLEDQRQFFHDFKPPADWTKIKSAIAWDSCQRLLINAARLFLGCSGSHAGNLLVNGDGQLFSIDHELVSRTDFREIGVLAENIVTGTRAHRAVQRIAALSELDVENLFYDLPDVYSGWPIGSLEKTIQYFINRLHLWKDHFAERVKAA